MLKNPSGEHCQDAQPILKGINLAKFLREPVARDRRDNGREALSGNCSNLPPVADSVSARDSPGVLSRDAMEIPGTL